MDGPKSERYVCFHLKRAQKSVSKGHIGQIRVFLGLRERVEHLNPKNRRNFFCLIIRFSVSRKTARFSHILNKKKKKNNKCKTNSLKKNLKIFRRIICDG